MKFAFFRFQADAHTDFFIYRGKIVIPTRFNNPLNPFFLRKGSRAYSYLRLFPEAVSGSRARGSFSGPPLRFDGLPHARELSVEGEASDWWALWNEKWGVFTAVAWSDPLRELHTHAYFHYRDALQGASPEIGYFFDILKFPRGPNAFTLHQYIGPNIDEDTLPRLYQNLSHPLRITPRLIEPGE